MKKSRLILLASLLSFGAVSTVLTSCESDTECNVGYEGKDCKDEVRNNYLNTYRGTASDNQGGTYTDWAMKFSKSGTTATKMQLEILDNNNANKFLFTTTLNTNTSFSIDPKSIDGFDYTGQGTISATSASLTLTEKDPQGVEVTYVYTFTNFIKE